MRVLQVITQSQLGGAQRHVLDLCEGLPKTWQIEVACGPGGALITRLRDAGTKVHEVPHLRRAIGPVHDSAALGELLRLVTRGYDVVHCHSTKAGALGRIAAALAKVPRVLFTAHGFVFNEAQPWLSVSAYATVERLLQRLSTRIITVSDADRLAALRHGFTAAKLVTIHNGISLERIDRPRSSTYRRTGQRIVAVGHAYPNKGFDTLLRALTHLPDAELFVAGWGVEADGLRAMAESLGVRRRIHESGELNDPIPLMRSADVVVVPSRKEGLPYVLLEAMACERAVVGTEVGGIPEVIEQNQNGIVVPPNDPWILAEAVRGLLADSERRRWLGRNARATVASRFTLARMLAQTCDVYESS